MKAAPTCNRIFILQALCQPLPSHSRCGLLTIPHPYLCPPTPSPPQHFRIYIQKKKKNLSLVHPGIPNTGFLKGGTRRRSGRVRATDHLQFYETFYTHTYMHFSEKKIHSSHQILIEVCGPGRLKAHLENLFNCTSKRVRRAGNASNLEITCTLEHLCFSLSKCLFIVYSSHVKRKGRCLKVVM